MVVPGDRLMLEVELKRMIRNMAMYEGVARVDGEVGRLRRHPVRRRQG